MGCKEPLPLGIQVMQTCRPCRKKLGFQIYILIYTFLIYITYHMARLPISIVKSVLHRNCSKEELTDILEVHKILYNSSNTTLDDIRRKQCSWVPFEQENYEQLYGILDYAYLLCYALGIFLSGQIAERSHIRYFLSIGMMLSGVFVILFGLGHTFKLHYFSYYLTIQMLSGLFQSSGWPCVVTCVANWFGDAKKGLIMGVWNTHTNIGNILGSVIPGIFVDTDWALSFMVPGVIIFIMGITVFFWITPYPDELGFSSAEESVAAESAIEAKDHGSTRVKNKSASKPTESTSLVNPAEQNAISILDALKIPGVVEFALGAFFIKLVDFTFLFWLPKYISSGQSANIDPQEAASLMALFDVGGMMGGIVIGLLADLLGIKAILCVSFLVTGAWPMFQMYQVDGSANKQLYSAFLVIAGFLVYAPYVLINTSVAAELGNHPSLHGNSRAMATVAAILDGTASIGAAFGPLVTGLIAIYGWNWVFLMLILSDLVAALMLSRLVFREIKEIIARYKGKARRESEASKLIEQTKRSELSQGN